MKTFKQHMLMEADTSASTDMEAAICIAHNMKFGPAKRDAVFDGKTWGEEELVAAEQAGIIVGAVPHKNLTSGQIQTAVALVNDSRYPSGIGYLTHSGRGMDGTDNKYPTLSEKYGTSIKAINKTPKTDIAGTKSGMISLKNGDSARLMDGKSDEAKGVVHAGLEHLALNEPKTIVKGLGAAVDILGKQMEATKKEYSMVIGAPGKKAGAKIAIGDWWINSEKKNSRRFDEVKKAMGVRSWPRKWPDTKETKRKIKMRGEKRQIEMTPKEYGERRIKGHLTYELKRYGATQASASSDRYRIGSPDQKYDAVLKFKPVPYLSYDELDDRIKTFAASTYNMQPHKMKAKYIKDVSREGLSNPQLRKEAVEIVGVAMQSKPWEDALKSFFSNNASLANYVVFEAASGYFKFHGTAANGDSQVRSPVANSIMTFVPSGLGEYHPSVWNWAKKHGHLMQTINVSQKGSGRARYMKMTIAAQGSVGDLTSSYKNNMTDSMKFMVEGIVDRELIVLNETVDEIEKQLLNEGWLGDIGKSIVRTAEKVKDAVANFFIRLFNKIVERLKQLVDMGVDKFMSFMGIELSGGYVKSPW
jgi:hypothetical protein